MKMRNQNAVHKESRENEHGGARTPCDSQIARRCLRLVSPKGAAQSLGCSPRTVQKWTSGEAPIPQARVLQIVRTTKDFILTDLRDLESAIDRMLLKQYRTTDSM